MDNYYGQSDYGELRNTLRPYLQDGEEVLWAGKPNVAKGARFNVGTLFVAGFAIVWLAFSVFWTVMASSDGGYFGAFGIPFIGVGVYLLYTAFFAGKAALKNTVYAVTDTRAVILTRKRSLGGSMSCKQYILQNIQSISLEFVKDDNGSIMFQLQTNMYGYRGEWRTDVMNECAFIAIDNVHRVYQILNERIGNRE